GSIQRLSKKGEVYVQYVMRGGRLAIETYPKGFAENAETEITIDKDLLEPQDAWKEKDYAIVYGLNRVTLGIAPYKVDEWAIKARFVEEAQLTMNENGYVVKIPPAMAEFYLWKNSAVDVSTVGDMALVTLKTQILVR